MGERFLIDTNVVIKFFNESYSEETLHFIGNILDQESIISFITQIELLVWDKSQDNLEIFKEFISGSQILGIDQRIIEKTIEIRRESKIKIPDALIAATAIQKDLVLISDNFKDFRRVESMGLKYFNPTELYL